MKKQLVLAGMLLATAHSVFAQSGSRKQRFENYQKQKAGMLSQQLHQSAAKGTATDPVRLTTSVTYEQGVLMDSISYIYGGARASEINPLDPASQFGFFRPDNPFRPFEIGNFAHDYLPYDTMYVYQFDGSTVALNTWVARIYDGADQMTEMWVKEYYNGAVVASYKFHPAYDGSSSMTGAAVQEDTSPDFSGSFADAGSLTILYNSESQRTEDLLVYSPSSNHWKREYTYNPAGRLASMTESGSEDGGATFVEDIRYIYAYDSDNRLIQVEELEYDGSSWTTFIDDVFGYTGTSQLPTYNFTMLAYTPGVLEPHSQMDAVLLPGYDRYDTVYIKENMGAGLEDYSFVKVHYNADGHITSREEYLWEDAPAITAAKGVAYEAVPNTITSYTYSAVMPSSIPNATTQQEQASVSLYPNPAATGIFVAGTGRMQVSVYNLSGQLLLQQSGTAQNGGMQLNIASLPAGTYIADVQTEKGSSKVKFLKQ